jgi:hypothetical protein
MLPLRTASKEHVKRSCSRPSGFLYEPKESTIEISSVTLLINIVFSFTEIQKPEMTEWTRGLHQVEIGSSAVLRCEMTGLPPPVITWYKDKKLVTRNTSRFITITEKSLEFDNASRADAGVYQCRGENYGGVIMSSNMTFLVGSKFFICR